MDKLTQKAFAKMEMAEHLARTAYDLYGQGKIDAKALGQRLADIKKRYSLTDAEQKAHAEWNLRRKPM